MKRDEVSFKAAAQSLGAWDERQAISPDQIRELQKQREARRQTDAARIADDRRRLLEARESLHFLLRLYDEDNARLSQLRRGSPEQFPGEEEAWWEFLSLALPEIRRAEAEYVHLAEVKL